MWGLVDVPPRRHRISALFDDLPAERPFAALEQVPAQSHQEADDHAKCQKAEGLGRDGQPRVRDVAREIHQVLSLSYQSLVPLGARLCEPPKNYIGGVHGGQRN